MTAGVARRTSFCIFESMNRNFTSGERELINVVNYFERQSKKLIAQGKLGEEHSKIQETVERFVEQVEGHANYRVALQEKRSQISKIIKDDVSCPNCHSRDFVKWTGVDKNEKGWKSNRYKCRRCNIQFTWHIPNNPWDFIDYTNEMINKLLAKIAEGSKEQDDVLQTMESTKAQLDKIVPIIQAHDSEYAEMQIRDEEMSRLVHDFTNSLKIEKIKMNTWEARKTDHK